VLGGYIPSIVSVFPCTWSCASVGVVDAVAVSVGVVVDVIGEVGVALLAAVVLESAVSVVTASGVELGVGFGVVVVSEAFDSAVG